MEKKSSSPTALHFKHSVLANYIFPTEILLCSSSTIILVRERQKVNPGSLFLIILVLLVQEFSRQGRRCSLSLWLPNWGCPLEQGSERPHVSGGKSVAEVRFTCKVWGVSLGNSGAGNRYGGTLDGSYWVTLLLH